MIYLSQKQLKAHCRDVKHDIPTERWIVRQCMIRVEKSGDSILRNTSDTIWSNTFTNSKRENMYITNEYTW